MIEWQKSIFPLRIQNHCDTELCNFCHFYLNTRHLHRPHSDATYPVQCSYYHITWQKYIYTVIHFVCIFMFISITYIAVRWATVNYLISRRACSQHTHRQIHHKQKPTYAHCRHAIDCVLFAFCFYEKWWHIF